MKAVLIVHNSAIDGEVNEALESAGIKCYSKFTNTLGKGEHSQPHLNTEVWPETNYGTLVVTDQVKAKAVMDEIRRMRGKFGSEGVKAFMWSIEEVT